MQQPTQLPVQESNPQSVMVIGATLTTADGKPVSNQKVEFLMGTDLLGKKWASIGTVASDSSGAARTTFVVTRTGTHEFSARFAGTDAFGPSEAAPVKADLEAAAETGHEGTTLPLIGRWVPWTGLAMGVVLWAYAPSLPPDDLIQRYANRNSQFIDIGGARAHVRDEGNKDGIPIVLIHGSMGSLHMWEGWVDRLKDRARLISVDLPGHGLDTTPLAEGTLDQVSADPRVVEVYLGR